MTVFRRRYLYVLLLIAVASLLVRLLHDYDIHTTAVLYVGVPFGIALALMFGAKDDQPRHWAGGYWVLVQESLIVMLASSVILFEGFLCVLVFMPLYFGVILVTFMIHWLVRKVIAKSKKGQVAAQLWPVLFVLLAVEGLTPELSFPRNNSVTVTRLIAASPAELQVHLREPIAFNESKPGWLGMFPVPYRVEAGSLKEGDVHRIFYRYPRWLIANVHEGEMALQIETVSPQRVTTRFLSDDSYIANYITLQGTEIAFEPVDDGNSTRLSLIIRFERDLDPAWYFQPLQRHAIRKTADYLITEVIARDAEVREPTNS